MVTYKYQFHLLDMEAETGDKLNNVTDTVYDSGNQSQSILKAWVGISP